MISLKTGEQIRLLFVNLIRRRLKLTSCICVLLFIINVYVICSYFQLYNTKTENQMLPFEHPNKDNIRGDAVRAPRCIFSDSLADSAFERMTTEECRKKLEDIYCEMDFAGWPVHAIENTCPSYDKTAFRVHRGCFLDNTKKRLLTGFKYDLNDSNTPDRCIQYCLRIGFQLAGVEYATECFCGNEADLGAGKPANSSECEKYPCPGNQTLKCGGFNVISVYTTGITNRHKPVPKYIELTEDTKRDVKILFLLQLNGRNSRQIRRLLRLLYQPKHLYFVHVDSRQRYMQREMMDIQILLEKQGYSNFHVSERRFPTVWGGSSLLEMFLYVIEWSLATPSFNNWDYILNLSESDFPVLSLAELEAVLAANKGKSFLSAHGYNTGTFLRKQGYNFHFMQCENRMWRFGPRNNYPDFLRVDGGSDWVIIDRVFAEFALSDAEVPRQMRKLFTSILLPLEGFFHTLSSNTKFCDKILYNNLRFTNWKRSQGCRCEILKPVVDWCGCSPLVLLLDDEDKFELNKTISKVNYFARKFESLIDIDSVAKAEEQVSRFELQKVLNDSPSYNATWANFYDKRFDEDDPIRISYSNLARVLYENAGLNESCGFGDLVQIHVYKKHSTARVFTLFRIIDACGSDYELKILRESYGRVLSTQLNEGYELKSLEFGTMLDLKEEIFRDFVSIIHTNETAVFQFQWQLITKPEVKRNTTSPTVIAQLLSPAGKLLKRDRVRPYDSINYRQHIKYNMMNAKKIEPGIHHFQLTSTQSNIQFGSIEFPVFPRQLDNQFRELATKFYSIEAICSNYVSGKLSECGETSWSSLFPDLKTQIVTGFNKILGTLN